MNKAALCAIGLAILAAVSHAASTGAANPYSAQEAREIKALSAEEVQHYLSGKGMGLAKAAELNGYPGPSHVLALAGELNLSAEQKQRTEALFKIMETKAKEVGRTLVDEERTLDHLFASKSISPESLTQRLKRIGKLQAQVRQVHLESHLAQAEILTPGQVAAYMKIRGYGGTEKIMEHSGHEH
jgi:Spy/CpxP family protein refolding chaperone